MLYDRGLPLPLINAMDDRGRERKKANIVPLKRRVGFERQGKDFESVDGGLAVTSNTAVGLRFVTSPGVSEQGRC